MHLRVRPGDQHALGDVQRQTVELPLADEVRHRLAVQMTLRQTAHLLLHRVGHVEPPVAAQLLAAFAGGAADQLPRFQRGVGETGAEELLADI